MLENHTFTQINTRNFLWYNLRPFTGKVSSFLSPDPLSIGTPSLWIIFFYLPQLENIQQPDKHAGPVSVPLNRTAQSPAWARQGPEIFFISTKMKPFVHHDNK